MYIPEPEPNLSAQRQFIGIRHHMMKLLVLVLPFASAFKLPISPKLSATAVTLAAPLPALAVYEPIHKVLPGTECE
jgi:hypothetical protein